MKFCCTDVRSQIISCDARCDYVYLTFLLVQQKFVINFKNKLQIKHGKSIIRSKPSLIENAEYKPPVMLLNILLAENTLYLLCL